MNLIIVTACPQGVATRFLAARALERAANRRGWSVTTDTRGPDGKADNKPSEAAIQQADLVIAAVGVPVNLDVYAGKRLLQIPVTAALPDPDAIQIGRAHV